MGSRRFHSQVWGAAALLLAAIPLSCRRLPDPEVRIGILSYVSGESRVTSGRSTIEAALLAQRELEERGGLKLSSGHYRVRLIVRDIADRSDIATSETRRLINEDSVVALVGPQFSRDAIPVASLAEQASIPMITPMSSHPRTTLGKRFVFRVAFSDDLQGAAMARFAYRTLGAHRAAILADVAGEYSRHLAEVFKREFERVGGQVVAVEQFTSDADPDFGPQLLRIRGARPDVIFLPNFIKPAATELVQARRLGIRAIFLGTDSWDPRLSAVPEADGAYFTSQWHPGVGTPEGERFNAGYAAAYGRSPVTTAAATYDALQLLFQAIESAGSVDPAAIRDALAATRGYRGVTGELSYRGGGDPRKSVFVLQVIQGGAAFERRVDPE